MKNNIESDFPPFGNPKSESASPQLGITPSRNAAMTVNCIVMWLSCPPHRFMQMVLNRLLMQLQRILRLEKSIGA
jgi:hypothetical protein